MNTNNFKIFMGGGRCGDMVMRSTEDTVMIGPLVLCGLKNAVLLGPLNAMKMG